MAKEQLNKGKLLRVKSRNPKIEFDKLKMYFREPYEIEEEGSDGKIILTQPSIGDVVNLGENRYYNTLNLFIANTTMFRLQLWEQGIDWNEISDFELFSMLVTASPMDREVVKTFLPDINFDDFKRYQKKSEDGSEALVLYDKEHGIEINEFKYHHISQYLRNTFNIFPEEKITKDAIMKKWFIKKDERELRNKEILKEQGKKEEDSGLFSVISGCCNHPGFKYKSSELKELGVFQFYDSVKRLQVYESTTALQKGMFSGFMDTKNIKAEDYNFMKAI